MSDKPRVVRNTLWNCAGIIVETLTGFAIAPFLIHRLGDTGYGLWIVLGSLTSYFGLLDLGVRGSVGRYIAYYRARGDSERLSRTLSTAVFLLLGVGTLAALGVLALVPAFPHIFEVPADRIPEVSLALALVGLNLGLWLIANAFDATLWGCQRFDLLNKVDIPATLLRAGLTFYAVGQGGNLVALALVTIAVTLFSGTIKAVLSFRVARGLRLSPMLFGREAAREVLGYGFWNFCSSIAKITRAQLSPLLIGSLLAVALITPFSVAGRLINYVAMGLAAVTGVLTPLATALHAHDRTDRQSQLFIHGGKYCFAFSLFLTTALAFLGGPLIGLWLGEGLLHAAPLLLILVLGELLPNSQYVTNGIILAAARHRALAWLSLIEVAAVATLTVLLLEPMGLTGACLAVAIPAVIFRGVAQIIQGCRVVNVSLWQYVRTALLPPLACAAVPAAALAAAVAWHRPRTWLELALYGACYGLLYLVCNAPLVGLGTLRRRAVTLLRRPAAQAGSEPDQATVSRPAAAGV